MDGVAINPPRSQVVEIIKSSEHTAAKWLKHTATGDMYYWPAEKYQHAHVAATFMVEDYTKGLATLD
jgi:hypothetical protein